MKKKLMFYCQHVLGMGHFIRSLEIVRGLTEFDVYFINGGEMIPNLPLPRMAEIIDLPALKSDSEFREIQSTDQNFSLDEVKKIRTKLILDAFDRIRPEVLAIELFPFGRLKFSFELMPLLERAKSESVKVVCSVRDILVSKSNQQQYEIEACQILNDYFDLLLIHSDPQFQTLEETFPSFGQIKIPIDYTGFVAQRRALHRDDEAFDYFAEASARKKILVSIGGGRVGTELIDCAIAAGSIIQARLPHQMLIFTGPYIFEEEWRRLKSKLQNESCIRLEKYAVDFISLMEKSDLSISLSGYNTCMNIMTTQVKAIVYPFTGNRNREQTIRARKLQSLGIVDIIEAPELLPRILAEKIIRNLSSQITGSSAPKLDLNGVDKTAEALKILAATH